MDKVRREVFTGIALTASGIALATIGLPMSASAAAARPVFDTKGIDEAMRLLGAAEATATDRITIEAPNVASNGSMIPVVAESLLPGTDYLAVFADKNPLPLLAEFDFAPGAKPYASIRVKMRETSNVRVIARSEGRFYVASRRVKVTIGGCGG
jgi:sulfur-oxidizing protein SoxY